jgi:flagellar protein FlaG
MDIKAVSGFSPPVNAAADRARQNLQQLQNSPSKAAAAPQRVPDSAAPEPEQPERVAQALSTINATLKTLQQGVEFTIDEKSRRTVVKVIDQETKQVLRQMPSQEMLDIANALDRLQGLLIRQEA